MTGINDDKYGRCRFCQRLVENVCLKRVPMLHAQKKRAIPLLHLLADVAALFQVL